MKGMDIDDIAGNGLGHSLKKEGADEVQRSGHEQCGQRRQDTGGDDRRDGVSRVIHPIHEVKAECGEHDQYQHPGGTRHV